MKGIKRSLMVGAVVILLLAAVEGDQTKTSPYKDCYGKCYSECNLTKPLFCASLCVGKCKQGKSIPDNLCNCTYSCSKFRCANVGSDPEKIQSCVSSCSNLCTRSNY
ncbi:thionin-like protein 2 [Rosa sericea]